MRTHAILKISTLPRFCSRDTPVPSLTRPPGLLQAFSATTQSWFQHKFLHNYQYMCEHAYVLHGESNKGPACICTNILYQFSL